jgi:hypothetical protein
MATANPQSYQGSPWGYQGWNDPPFWHPAGMSRPVGIAAMILGFALFWPIGLAILAFLIASGRLGCRHRRWAQWGAQGPQQPTQGGNTWNASPPWAKWCGGDRAQTPPSSGNHAFDDYRAETLRRLEEEQSEFSSFLERLRFAKDKAEFDQFMNDRRQAPRPPATTDDHPQG